MRLTQGVGRICSQRLFLVSELAGTDRRRDRFKKAC
jgi:hypothetical protein